MSLLDFLWSEGSILAELCSKLVDEGGFVSGRCWGGKDELEVNDIASSLFDQELIREIRAHGRRGEGRGERAAESEREDRWRTRKKGCSGRGGGFEGWMG